ncbi:class I SAM-dependent methyltransferase [Nocardiopsis ganjiahuensis]|uniref:class I SAM-dependent methyltransferase n=1 Tax=Nocardiopsis ganjiahuensis TaxID=239984 RepID=UPI000363AA23|nr:class I SAM-dependent methyltransferase [Nocardiopsis ganjiahuensis]
MNEPFPTSPPSPPSPVASRLSATADAYDSVAALYTELARNELDAHPLDRALLAAFAEYVRGADAGPVVELGCGPGRITAHLRDLGLDAFGVDLSPVMVGIARETYPDLRFEVGSMDALDLAEDEVNAVVAWYSVIHAPPEDLPAYLAEFRRVLAPGGHLLLAFFESSGDPVTEFDHKVVTAYRWPIDRLAELAGEAGFVELGRTLREPVEGERPFRHGRLLMRLPAHGDGGGDEVRDGDGRRE